MIFEDFKPFEMDELKQTENGFELSYVDDETLNEIILIIFNIQDGTIKTIMAGSTQGYYQYDIHEESFTSDSLKRIKGWLNKQLEIIVGKSQALSEINTHINEAKNIYTKSKLDCGFDTIYDATKK